MYIFGDERRDIYECVVRRLARIFSDLRGGRSADYNVAAHPIDARLVCRSQSRCRLLLIAPFAVNPSHTYPAQLHQTYTCVLYALFGLVVV